MPTCLFLLIHVDLPPPSKRRRGLAGSIVSTALSAALIGTAVGLTVYRLYVPSPNAQSQFITFLDGATAAKTPNPNTAPSRPRRTTRAAGQ